MSCGVAATDESRQNNEGEKMSDETYLGAYEDNTQIKIVIDKAILEDFLNYVGVDDEVIVSDKQFADFLKRANEVGLVSDFIEAVVTLAEEVIEGN